MRKLRSLSLLVLLLAAVGYAARRLLAPRESEWQTLSAVPSPAAAEREARAAEAASSPDPFWDVAEDTLEPSLGPENVDLAEPAEPTEPEDGDPYEPDDVEPAETTQASTDPVAGTAAPKPFDPLTDPLPDEDLE